MSYAWVIDDGITVAAYAVSDVIGISNIQLDRIRLEVNEQVAIPVQNIFISSTHTHSGADLQGLWGGASQGYKDMFVTLTSNAIISAYNTRKNCDLFISKTNGTEWARNRRGWGWTNDEMTIIDAYNVQTGEREGTFINFAVHPVVLDTDNLEFSADFAGYLRSHMKAGLGGDAPVAYVNGAEGIYY